jgi:nucleotide-binding universal stress UspA family protein
MYKHILIPTDGSDLSLKAVQHGILLAKAVGAKVTSITVVSPVLLFSLEPDRFKELSEEWGYKPQVESFA